MGKSLHKAGRRIKTEEEFDKRCEELTDKREDAIYKLIEVQFELQDLFDKDYDRLFNNKRR